LKGNTFLEIYGVNGAVNQVPDVYDDHPVIHSIHTTTGTTTQKTGLKTATTTLKEHGPVTTRPLFLHCNLTKSVYGKNTIMKAVRRDYW